MTAFITNLIKEYTTLYVLWFGVVTLLFLGIKRKKWDVIGIVFILCAYALYIFMVLHREIDYGSGGMDAINYKRYFELANLPYMEYISITKEWLFWTVTWIFYKLIPNYIVYIFVLHTLEFILFMKCIREVDIKRNTVLAWMYIFLFSVYIIYMFNILRTCIAVYIATLAIFRNLQGKTNKAIVYSIIAVGVHTCAFPVLIASVIFFLRSKGVRIKTSYWVAVGLLLECALLLYLSSHPLTGQYELYNTFHKGSIAKGRIIVLIVGLLVVCKQKKQIVQSRLSSSLITEKDVLLTALLIIPMNIMYSIANRMYLVYLPILYTIFYYEYNSVDSFECFKHISKRKLYAMAGAFIMLVDVVRFATVIIPEAMGKFAIVL